MLNLGTVSTRYVDNVPTLPADNVGARCNAISGGVERHDFRESYVCATADVKNRKGWQSVVRVASLKVPRKNADFVTELVGSFSFLFPPLRNVKMITTFGTLQNVIR